MAKDRIEVVDLLKGIGILSVVIGHSAPDLPLTHFDMTRFVYMYHMMVFVFTAGFLFDEKKDHIVVIGKRVYGLWKPFVLYNLLFVLLHNGLAAISFISSKPYDADKMLSQALKGIVFQSDELMLGAFWYLPFLLITGVLLCVLFRLSGRISGFRGGKVLSALFWGAVLLSSAWIGLYLHRTETSLRYHLHTALLALPVMFLGWAVKKEYTKVQRWTGWPGALVSGVLLFLLVRFTPFYINLSHNQIENLWLFYPVTLLGLYFCLCLAKVLQAVSFLRRPAAFFGRYSLHIMALHFLAFKVLDHGIALVRGDPAETAVQYPYAYNLGLGYCVFTMLLVGGGILLLRKARQALKARGESDSPN